jgi:hexosaminidase
MNVHVCAAGRRLIGWDEILEGGLSEGSTVMSWRGESGGLAAASENHDVVMAPCEWVYFDHYQANPISEEPLAIGGMSPTDRVYAYEPIPVAMKPEHRAHVLGSQGQLWTEYMADMSSVEYMAFPRICALAEVLWLDAEKKNYADFLTRLHHHRERLAVLGVNAHPRP